MPVDNLNNTLDSNAPFFTVCVPVYNAEKYLAQCLDSVLSQSETDYEIVLVNDGSQDNSGKICDEYAARYPNVVRALHQENAGPLIARVRAIRTGRGRYFMFLDSDDIYFPDALKKVRNAIETFDVDLTLFSFAWIYPDGSESNVLCDYEDGFIFEGERKRLLFEDLIAGRNSLNSLCFKCVRRDLLDCETDYEKYKGLKFGEDKLATFSYVDRAKRTIYLKEPLYGYRINPQSTMKNYAFKHYQDIQVVFEREDEYIKRWNMPFRSVVLQKRLRLVYASEAAVFSYNNLKAGKITFAEFAEIVDYVAADEKFQEAFKIAKKRLTRFQQTICKLMLKRNARGLVVLFRGFYTLSALKRRVLRCVKRS